MGQDLESMKLPKYLKILIYGEYGGGKTRFISTAPKPLLLLNFDPEGYVTILGTPGVTLEDLYTPTVKESKHTKMVLDKTLNDLEKIPEDKFPYATIALDSLSFLSQIYMGYITSLTMRADKIGVPVVKGSDGGAMRESDYGTLGDIQEDVIKRFLGLPCHFILTSHARVATQKLPGNLENVLYLPAMEGIKFPQQLPGYFTEVYKMITVAKAPGQMPDYKLQTRADFQWGAKTRLNYYDTEKGEPVSVLNFYEEPNFSKLVEKLESARRKANGTKTA